jgi:hypothetical protein
MASLMHSTRAARFISHSRSALLLAGIVICLAAASSAQTPQYVGPGSCASSSCHGAVQPRTSTRIPQTEYSTWVVADKHAKAFTVLGSDLSRTIARNLRLPQAPGQSPQCLSCHALDVPSAQRTRAFEMDDGVSCERCHGPASAWLGPHATKGWQHQQSVQRGMIDTKNISVRAELCLSCHLGTATRAIDHRMLAAGHPDLTFELDSYSAVMPRHWKDPLEKDPWIGVRTWSTGQALQLREALLRLARNAESDHWPEYAEYDCAACHHSLTEPRQSWRQLSGYGKRMPGVPPWNDAHLVVLKSFASGALAGDLERLSTQMSRLQPDGAAVATLAKRSAAEAEKLARELSGQSYDASRVKELLRVLTADPEGVALRGERVAEQNLLAVNTLFIALQQNHAVANESEIKAAIDVLFQQLRNPSAFNARAYTVQMQRINRALR